MKFQPINLLFTLVLIWVAAAAHAEEIVVIVNPAAGFNALTAADVRLIFMCKNKILPDRRPALPLMQSEDSETRIKFDRAVLQRDPRESRAYWAQMIFTGRGKPPRQLSDDDAMKKAVASNPSALGYIRRASLDDSVKGVLILTAP